MKGFLVFLHFSDSMAAHANEDGERVYVYVDNSNLWIEGQRAYARVHNYNQQFDSRWRIDVGRLKQHILRGRRWTRGTVYGSVPPPSDTVWEVMEGQGFSVRTFPRSSWSKREKRVDGTCIRDMTYHASKYPMDVAVIVSGDSDMVPCAAVCIREGVRVEIWSFESAINQDSFRRMVCEDLRDTLMQDGRPTADVAEQVASVDGMLTFNTLDGNLEDIGFTAAEFRLSERDLRRNANKTFFLLDVLTMADRLRDFWTHFNLPVYTLMLRQLRRPGAENQQDMAIVITFDITIEQLDDAITQTRRYLPPARVVSYPEYMALVRLAPDQDIGTVTLGDNSFALLEDEADPGDDGGADIGGEGAQAAEAEVEVDAPEEEWTAVVHQKGPKLPRVGPRRCDFYKYCKKGSRCTFRHTYAELEFFKTQPGGKGKNPVKINICINGVGCLNFPRCWNAHKPEDQVCRCCEKVGHGFENCPQRDKD
jgi:uncharacterized LabA/DUF88 family protein